jgi:hypothetical protein
MVSMSPLVFRPTYLFRNRWLPTKFPLLLARRQARARLLREYSILSGESSLTFFSLLNLPCHVPLRTVSFEWNQFITWCQGSSYSSKPCGWCAVSSPCGKFERTLPTPLREDFGPNAKARDAIEVDSCEAFPLPEGIGESSCRQCATRSTPLGNPPSPPLRLRPQPSYVEVKRKPCVGLIVDAPETSVAPVSSLEPSAPLKGLCHQIPERLGKDTLLYGPWARTAPGDRQATPLIRLNFILSNLFLNILLTIS